MFLSKSSDATNLTLLGDLILYYLLSLLSFQAQMRLFFQKTENADVFPHSIIV